ncbi:TPA: hypothetical protein J4Z72_004325, partial [Escherichia coli]|nr:hypothetical protein [Escherichia coli]
DTLAGKKNAALTGAVNPIDGIHQGFAVRAGGTFIKQIKLRLAARKIGQHDTGSPQNSEKIVR